MLVSIGGAMAYHACVLVYVHPRALGVHVAICSDFQGSYQI